MPNYDSAVKAMKQNAKKALRNKSKRSSIKTNVKKFLALLNNENESLEQKLLGLREVQSKIMSGTGKNGVLAMNQASRQVSKLHKKYKALEAAAQQ